MREDKIIIHEVKNSGLILADPSPENYHSHLFGAVGEQPIGVLSPLTPPPVIFPDGIGWKSVWLKYNRPEIQFNRNFDSFCCVIYTIAKACCLYLYHVYGIEITISEMYNAFFAEVVRNQGTTIEKGMESFRNHGWLSDEEYPFTATMTADDFFRKPQKSIILKAEGKLTEWNFYWEVLPKVLSAIFEQYKRTPVVLTGFAWASYYGTGVYYDYNNRANHAFLGIEKLQNGNNQISDTYPKDYIYQDKSELDSDELLKELDKSFKYGSAHYCWLTPKVEKVGFYDLIKKYMQNIKLYIMKPGGSVWFAKFDDKIAKYKIQEIKTWQALMQVFAAFLGAEAKDSKEFAEAEKGTHPKMVQTNQFFPNQ